MHIVKTMQMQQNRSNTAQREFMSQVAESLIRLIDDIPVDNTYCYNLKIAIPVF